MTGVVNRTWEFTTREISSSDINVAWEYMFPGKKVLDKWRNPKRTGFSLTWYQVKSGVNEMPDIPKGLETWKRNRDETPPFTQHTKLL